MNDHCQTCATSEAGFPPGQDTLRARLGTQPSFFEAMTARLSQLGSTGLRTRALSDPAIAWLDAGATVDAILSFYQERIANEGYLRTATEDRSITELARLVGYSPRPGVSASCHLAYSLEKDRETVIPAGTRAASTPGQNELPQVFETATPLGARAQWNAIRPRPTRPQVIEIGQSLNITTIWLVGITTNIKPGDLLLFEFPVGNSPAMRRVQSATIDPSANRTTIELQIDPLSARKPLAAARLVLATHMAEKDLTNIPSPQTDVTAVVTANNTMIANVQAATPDGVSLVALDAKLTDELTEIDAVAKAANDLTQTYGAVAADIKALHDGVNAILAASGASAQLITQFTATKTWYDTEDIRLFHFVTDFSGITLNSSDDGDALKQKVKDAKENVLQPLMDFLATSDGQRSLGSLKTAAGTLKSALVNLENWDFTANPSTSDFVDAFVTAQSAFLDQKFTHASGTQPLNMLTALAGNLNASNTLAVNAGHVDTAITSTLNGLISAATATGYRDRLAQLKSQLLKVNGIEPDVRAKLNAFPATPASTMRTDVLTLIATLRTTLNAPTAVVDSLDAIKTLVTALTNNPASVITVAAKKLADSATTLRDALIPILWPPRRAVYEAISKIVDRAAILDGLNDDVSKQANKIMTDMRDRIKSLVDSPTPTDWNLLKTSTITILLQEQLDKAVTDATQLIGTISSAGRPILNNLLRDLATMERQINPQLNPVGLPNATAQNELAGLFDANQLLGGERRLRVERPDPNPNLVLGTTVGQTAVDAIPRFLQAIHPDQTAELFRAWRGKRYEADEVKVWVFRQKTQLFGYNAPTFVPAMTMATPPVPTTTIPPVPTTMPADELASQLFLSEGYDAIMPQSFVVVERQSEAPESFRVGKVSVHPRTAYGLSARTTQIDLDEGKSWRTGNEMDLIRTTTVYAQAEKLDLAEVPLEDPVGLDQPDDPDDFQAGPDVIELDDLYDGLDIGRTVIVGGELERLDGVVLAEPATIAGVTHVRRQLFGDTPHTRLSLTAPLDNVYKRPTVVVYGNIVRATHGETHREVLGSGDGSKTFQEFTLKFSPLTHLSAATAAGAAPAIEVRVNDVVWDLVADLSDLGPSDRGYILRIGEDQTATVVFGDGLQGARLPTGTDNVRAIYRNGLGRSGNLPAARIDQTMDRPLGVKSVTNPLPSSGGTDRETPDQARRNAPLNTRALGRVVSLADYADFARTFAGVGKASAIRLPGPTRSVVHLTLGGADPAPLRTESDLFASLRQAFTDLGDDNQPVVFQPCARVLLVVIASVRVAEKYDFVKVEARVRAALLKRFGYERQDLATGVTASEVLTTIHRVEGVAFANLTALGAVRDFNSQNDINSQLDKVTKQLQAGGRSLLWVSAQTAAYQLDPETPYEPAEVVYLDAGLPEALLLSEVKP